MGVIPNVIRTTEICYSTKKGIPGLERLSSNLIRSDSSKMPIESSITFVKNILLYFFNYSLFNFATSHFIWLRCRNIRSFKAI